MNTEALINGQVITLEDEHAKLAENFHKARIPFMWINGNVVFNLSHTDGRDHQHWACEDFGLTIEEFEEIPRGYMIKDRIQLYIGSDFRPINSVEAVVITEESFNRIVETYFRLYPQSPDVKVYNGVNIGEVGTVWTPMNLVAKYAQITKIIRMEI